MKTKLIYLALVSIITSLCFFYGCSKSSNPNPGMNNNNNGSMSVSIQNFAFAPDTLKVSAGSTVTWTNTDAVPHTVTSLTNLFDSGSIATSGTFKFTFAAAGTYTYHCTIHSMMKAGVVVVK